MTLDAMNLFGWPAAGIAARLRKHHDEIPKLAVHQQAISRIGIMGIQVLPLSLSALELATVLCRDDQGVASQKFELLAMRGHALNNLASLDTDFDRVPGLTRFAPV
jgi:hypothetical protein